MNRDALVIGVNRYPGLKDSATQSAPHLTAPAKDAEAIAHLLETQGKFTVRRIPQSDDRFEVDPDQLVTTEELKQAIVHLFHPITNDLPDVALLYFSGHGLRHTDIGNVTEGYLATSDTCPRKEKWGVSLQWLRQLLKNSPVRQQIVWLDCCKSGELFNFAPEDLKISDSEKVRFFISAARDFENAYSNLKKEHGALTELLLRYLEPNQAINDGVINSVILTKLIEGKLKLPQKPIIYCDQNKPINLTAIPEKLHLLEQAVLTSESDSKKQNNETNQSKNTKEQIMDKKEYLMQHLQSEGGLDFIEVANHQKYPDLYPQLLSIIHSQLEKNGVIGLLLKLQKTPSPANRSIFLQVMETQIDEDEEQVFTNQLIAVFKQIEATATINNTAPVPTTVNHTEVIVAKNNTFSGGTVTFSNINQKG